MSMDVLLNIYLIATFCSLSLDSSDYVYLIKYYYYYLLLLIWTIFLFFFFWWAHALHLWLFYNWFLFTLNLFHGALTQQSNVMRLIAFVLFISLFIDFKSLPIPISILCMYNFLEYSIKELRSSYFLSKTFIFCVLHSL